MSLPRFMAFPAHFTETLRGALKSDFGLTLTD